MKLVVGCNYYDRDEFIRIMKIVKWCGEIVSEPDDNDIDYIYVQCKYNIYKFNRYNKLFIEKVEEAINSCSYYQYEGLLNIVNIDDRFTDTKYYTISCKFNSKITIDYLSIEKDKIINDLYNNTYVYNL